MTNPFSTDALLKSVSNYPVAKGDVTGHPFHGNQYASNPFNKDFDRLREEGAGYSAREAARRARDLFQHGLSTHAQIANAHRAAAFEHGIASQVLKNALDKETNPEKRGVLKAAIAAHDHAAEVHNWIATKQANEISGPIARDNTMHAEGASLVAERLGAATGADTGAEFR